jgi:peptidoglycan hydrolase-like protein with peptidoglycan-binding domain
MDTFEHHSDRFGLINVNTLAGIQTALEKIGYDPGKIDGIDGPNTNAAVKAFQKAAGIGVDGIAGPKTKKALLVALEHAASGEGTAQDAVAAAADAVKNLMG